MPTTTIDAEIVLRTEKALAELRKLPNVTEAEAKKMASALSREYAKAEKAAEKAAANAKREIANARKEAEKSAEKLGKALAEQFGGPIAKLADLSTGTAGAVGAIGAAGFAAVAGVGALAAGAKRLADSAVEARDRLLALGLDAEIPPEAAASLAAYESASRDLQVQLDLLTVTIGSDVAGALTDVALVAADAVSAFLRLSEYGRDVDTVFGQITERAQLFARVGTAIGSLGISEAFLAIAGSAREEADAHREAAEAASNQTEMLVALGMVSEDTQVDLEHEARLRREATEAAKMQAEAARRAAEAERAAAAERAELLRENQAIVDELDAQAEERRAAELAATKAHQNALMAAELARWQSYAAEAEIATDAAIAAIQEQIDESVAAFEAQKAAESAAAENALQLIDTVLGARIAALERGNKEDRRQARNLAAIQRGSALFGIGANTAEAILKAFALFGPPPSPAGIASAAAAGFAGATQAAVVLSQPLPELPMGRPPTQDHTETVRIRPDEAVLDGRTTQRLGGADGIRALLDGAALGPKEVAVYLDGREFARAVMDRGGRAQPTPGSWAAGRRVLYGGR